MKFCFCIPFYNHPAKITALVQILSKYKHKIFIIDDGSNEESKVVLKNLNQKNIEIFTRKINGGKGAAIKDGLNLAFSQGFTHAFQIDADMQHELDKMDIFIALAEKNQSALICGQSVFENAPKARLYGRKITDFWVWVNTLGGSIKESMCGFRIYPLKEICPLLKRCKSNRMDFDIDILLLAYKAGICLIYEEIKVSYENDGVSHFKAFKDNVLISLMHTRHFFALPKFIFTKKKQNKAWFEKEEKAGYFWLKITLFLVKFLPNFLLKFACFFVSLFFYIFSPKERENIKTFYINLRAFQGKRGLEKSKIKIFSNFYEFGLSIADKIAVYKGKFQRKHLLIKDEVFLINELIKSQKGQIILCSHLGNVEVARVLSKALKNLRLSILVYEKNARDFFKLINEISEKQINVFYVDELDVAKMLELKNLLESGVHLGIMGDRVAIEGKNLQTEFLDKPCLLPQGAFLLAHLLEAEISMLWCVKRKGGYEVELEKIRPDTNLSRDENIAFCMKQYIQSLEKRLCKTPQMWFNFYDFWEQR